MIILNLNQPPVEVLCHRCEQPLKIHVDGDCPNRKQLSRRFFMGMLGGAAAIAASQAMANVVLQAAEVGQNVVLAAPKIHDGSAFMLSGSLESYFWDRPGTIPDIQRHIQEVADKGHRMVMATVKVTREKSVTLYAQPDLKKGL